MNIFQFMKEPRGGEIKFFSGGRLVSKHRFNKHSNMILAVKKYTKRLKETFTGEITHEIIYY